MPITPDSQFREAAELNRTLKAKPRTLAPQLPNKELARSNHGVATAPGWLMVSSIALRSVKSLPSPNR
jgi:hypothetical protein